eukprot:scaffold6573_cov70-Phaeocystis_antarctica.AAC.1
MYSDEALKEREKLRSSPEVRAHTDRPHTARTPHAHRPHTARTPHAHRTHTARTPHAHRTHTARTPHAHRTHTAAHLQQERGRLSSPRARLGWTSKCTGTSAASSTCTSLWVNLLIRGTARQHSVGKDWNADSNGDGVLDFHEFSKAWFQLADINTEGVSPEVYSSWLIEATDNITEPASRPSTQQRRKLRLSRELLECSLDEAEIDDVDERAHRVCRWQEVLHEGGRVSAVEACAAARRAASAEGDSAADAGTAGAAAAAAAHAGLGAPETAVAGIVAAHTLKAGHSQEAAIAAGLAAAHAMSQHGSAAAVQAAGEAVAQAAAMGHSVEAAAVAGTAAAAAAAAGLSVEAAAAAAGTAAVVATAAALSAEAAAVAECAAAVAVAAVVVAGISVEDVGA